MQYQIKLKTSLVYKMAVYTKTMTCFYYTIQIHLEIIKLKIKRYL